MLLDDRTNAVMNVHLKSPEESYFKPCKFTFKVQQCSDIRSELSCLFFFITTLPKMHCVDSCAVANNAKRVFFFFCFTFSLNLLYQYKMRKHLFR